MTAATMPLPEKKMFAQRSSAFPYFIAMTTLPFARPVST